MFMLARRAVCNSARWRSRVTRVGKLSSGIMFAPLANTGMPLMTKAKLRPQASFSRFSSTVRSPVRRSARASSTPPGVRLARTAYIGWLP